jgi:hypothetical protein
MWERRRLTALWAFTDSFTFLWPAVYASKQKIVLMKMCDIGNTKQDAAIGYLHIYFSQPSGDILYDGIMHKVQSYGVKCFLYATGFTVGQNVTGFKRAQLFRCLATVSYAVPRLTFKH